MRSARPNVASQKPPPESWVGARDLALQLIRPLESFLGVQAASGIVLLIAATVAMLWANSPWRETLVLGVTAGLLVGKPRGIVSFCWLATRLGSVKTPTRNLRGLGAWARGA